MFCKDILINISDFLNFKESIKLGFTCKKIYNEKFFTQDYYINRLRLHVKNKEWIRLKPCGFICYHPCTIINYKFIKNIIILIIDPIGSNIHREIRCLSIQSFFNQLRDVPHPVCEFYPKVTIIQNRTLTTIGTYDPSINKSFAVGDYVDVVDGDGIWYEAIIIYMDNKSFRIHFRNWSSLYDISLDKNSKLIFETGDSNFGKRLQTFESR